MVFLAVRSVKRMEWDGWAVITWILKTVEGSDTFDPHAKHTSVSLVKSMLLIE